MKNWFGNASWWLGMLAFAVIAVGSYFEKFSGYNAWKVVVPICLVVIVIMFFNRKK